MPGAIKFFIGVFFLPMSPILAGSLPIYDLVDPLPDQAWGLLVIKNLHTFSQQLDGYLQTKGKEPMDFEKFWVRKLGLGHGIATDKPTALIVFEPTRERPEPVVLLLPIQEFSLFESLMGTRTTGVPDLMEGSNDELGSCFFAKKSDYVLLSPYRTLVSQVLNSTKKETSCHIAELLKKNDLYLRINKDLLGSMVEKHHVQNEGALVQVRKSSHLDKFKDQIEHLELGVCIQDSDLGVIAYFNFKNAPEDHELAYSESLWPVLEIIASEVLAQNLPSLSSLIDPSIAQTHWTQTRISDTCVKAMLSRESKETQIASDVPADASVASQPTLVESRVKLSSSSESMMNENSKTLPEALSAEKKSDALSMEEILLLIGAGGIALGIVIALSPRKKGQKDSAQENSTDTRPHSRNSEKEVNHE
jgi:hypothetical protein